MHARIIVLLTLMNEHTRTDRCYSFLSLLFRGDVFWISILFVFCSSNIHRHIRMKINMRRLPIVLLPNQNFVRNWSHDFIFFYLVGKSFCSIGKAFSKFFSPSVFVNFNKLYMSCMNEWSGGFSLFCIKDTKYDTFRHKICSSNQILQITILVFWRKEKGLSK